MSKIILKTPQELNKMRAAGKLAAQLLDEIKELIKPGTSTEDLNTFAEDFAKKYKATHAPKGYKGYSKSICTSINEVVCHGIPKSKDILEEGDIINVDTTLVLDGYHGDTSRTFLVGEVSTGAQRLVERTRKALDMGISVIRPGAQLNDIGQAIEKYIRPFGYSIVTQLGGHGIGKGFHEAPYVHHHRVRGKSVKFLPGMTFTVEPMINEGREDVFIDEIDGWTVYTEDDKLSAQFEHTVAVTEDGVEILTLS